MNKLGLNEQELQSLRANFEYLAPPQQEYTLLASSLMKTIGEGLSDMGNILAEYFRLFANGYAYWQQSYDYARIQEYFWTAYINAKRSLERLDSISVGDKQDLEDLFMNLSIAIIENTNCENSLACSMPLWLKTSSHKAEVAMSKAKSALGGLDLGQLSDPLGKYLEMNLLLYKGLQRCAQIYLMAWQENPREAELKTLEAEVSNILADLTNYSRELYSELRAHLAFCVRNAKIAIDAGARLLIKQSNFTLRAIAYAGPDLIKALYKEFKDDKGKGDITIKARQNTGLDLHDIRSGYLNETFETNIGIETLEPIYFELSSGEDGVTFTIPDGDNNIPYMLEAFRITVVPFGGVSVDFEFSLGDGEGVVDGISVSHTRVFEAMMGPHMGVFEAVWNQPPTGDFINPEAVNFVGSFRQCEQWVEKILALLPRGAEREYVQTEIVELLDEWKEKFHELGDMLRDPSRGTLYTEDIDLSSVQGAYQQMRDIFGAWDWVQSDLDDDSEPIQLLKKEARQLFPKGHIFSQLSDIGKEVIARFKEWMIQLAQEHDASATKEDGYKYHEDDIRGNFWFDPSYGWQSINLVNQLVLKRPNGTIIDPTNDDQLKQIENHPDFLGFKITSREARAGLDDWYYATQLESQPNLATIRSHTTDFFFVEQNRVFIYMPDDPQFITEQYVDTANWAGNLVIVLIANQVFCKNLIEDIEAQLNQFENGLLSADKLPYLRGKIQIANRQVEQVMDLVRGFAMTKYVDHSELLRAIVKSSRIEFLSEILQEHVATLNRYYAYMGDLLAGSVRY